MNGDDEKAPRIVEIDPECIDRRRLGQPAEALRRGELVAFPTETVYGLGANALDEAAVRRIFEAKKRPPGHPLIVHVASRDQARGLAAVWSESAERLAQAFWPGPLTLIVAKTDRIPDIVTGGLPTVGLRMPDHPVALALIEQAGLPVAAPSANPHTRISPTSARHVVSGLGGRVDWLVDAGPTEVGIESTVVRLDGRQVTILRPGAISPRQIAELLGEEVEVVVSEGQEPTGADRGRDGPHPSPGMAETHYAPEGRVVLVDSDELDGRLSAAEVPEGVCALLIDDPENTAARRVEEAGLEAVEMLPADPAIYAEGLYASLHRLDAAGCGEIWIEEPPETEDWLAVRDRINRASA